jgi:hypothetical protein
MDLNRVERNILKLSSINLIPKVLLLSSSLVFLAGCLSSPEKSSRKINAITNIQTTAPTVKPLLENQIKEKDRCVGIKPSDEFYQLCVDRVRSPQDKVKNKTVVFEWKKK